MSKLQLCAVCHAATGVTTRLVSGSLVERLRPSAPAVGDDHIDTHLCPECIQAAAKALEARIGQNAGVALAVDYTGVLGAPSRDGAKATAARRKVGGKPTASPDAAAA